MKSTPFKATSTTANPLRGGVITLIALSRKNSPGTATPLKETVIVGSTFGLMWVVCWFLLFARYNLEQDYKRALRKLERNHSLINPKASISTKMEAHVSAELGLIEYVDAMFPVVFSNRSESFHIHFQYSTTKLMIFSY